MLVCVVLCLGSRPLAQSPNQLNYVSFGSPTHVFFDLCSRLELVAMAPQPTPRQGMLQHNPQEVGTP